MNFQGRHAIVTGGSSGIGKATAKLFVSRGANITIIARTRATLESAQAEIAAECVHSSQKVVTISADVSDHVQVENAVKSAIQQLGAPDFLFPYAGMTHPGYFSEIPLEIFEQSMAVNYFGTLYTIRAALPAMQEQRRGHIVLMSSLAGIIGVYGYSVYVPAKFAVCGLAETLRTEMKPYGIKVSLLCPPDVDTPLYRGEVPIRPFETQMLAGNVKVLSVNEVAQATVKGMERNAFLITLGLETTLIGRLHSLLNPVLNWYTDGIVAKARIRHAASAK